MAVAPTVVERLTALSIQFVGLAFLAGGIAVVAAFLYRWYVRDRIPWGLALLVGLAGVAAYLNTTTVLGEIISGSDDVTQAQEALFNIGAFGAGAVGARIGRRTGDGFADGLFGTTAVSTFDEGVGRVVKAVGRVITVELPPEIDDVVGYDPVSPATKEALADRRFLFPRGLTVDELRDRLVARIKTDYAVGHVDLDLDTDGTVTFLAVASRAAGIGPTLAPATKAIALRADPGFAASAGDVVQVWAGTPPERLFTAELRGVAGDVVTLAVDDADVQAVDQSRRHRLVTLPVADRTDREFASMLRAADETHTAVTVQPGSPLDGLAVGALDVTVLGVTSPGSQPDTLPAPSRIVAAGDVVNALARPAALRRLEAAAAGPPPDASPGTADDGEGSFRPGP
jgi:hypothetical protein